MPQKKVTSAGKVRWTARYYDSAGGQHSKSFPTRAAAKAFEEESRRAVRRGEWLNPATEVPPLRVLVEQWRDLAVREGTRADRQMLIDNLDWLGELPITQISGSQLVQWAKQLRDGRPWANDKPLSALNVANRVGQMRGIFAHAVADGIIIRNAAESLKRFPAGVQNVAEIVIPTVDEVQQLLDAANLAWLHAGVRLAAEAGLRAGEIAGLRICDVDFMRRQLHIRVQAGIHTGETMPLKTRTSRRDIPLSSSLALELSGLVDDGVAPGSEGPLLRTLVGTGLSRRAMAPSFVRLRRKAGVREEIHLHSLRHFFASRMLGAGVPLPDVSKLLGHANPATTARVYAHAMPDSEDVVRRIVESLSVSREGFLRDFDSSESA